MKKNTLKFIILELIVAIFLLNCNNKTVVTQEEDNIKMENGYKKHEIIYENKHISFIIPDIYTTSYRPDRILDMWAGCDKKYIYYSPENDDNSLSFVIFENDYDESSIDSFIIRDIKESIYMELPIVPFYEKRKDKNGHVYYLCVSSCYDFLKEESKLPVEMQNCIYSQFLYVTYFGKKAYLFMLKTREKIKDFSYEEKKYIVESVRIEEIK
jgi:hypothetical protein